MASYALYLQLEAPNPMALTENDGAPHARMIDQTYPNPSPSSPHPIVILGVIVFLADRSARGN